MVGNLPLSEVPEHVNTLLFNVNVTNVCDGGFVNQGDYSTIVRGEQEHRKSGELHFYLILPCFYLASLLFMDCSNVIKGLNRPSAILEFLRYLGQ